MQEYRPGYAFWQHVFTLPDHSIAFGSATDGRLLALFPVKGEWTRQARWTDPSLAHVLDGQRLVRKVGDRRDQVATLIERTSGPVLHNSTRGDALLPNATALWRVSRRMGGDLRALRCPAGHRPCPGDSRIGTQREAPLGGQRHRLLPVAAEELEAPQSLLAGADRWQEPDDAGAVLCSVSVGARDEIRFLHPGAVRAQRRRNECRADADQRRTHGRNGYPRRSTCSARSWPATSARCRARATRTSMAATVLARISTRKWCSATRSS